MAKAEPKSVISRLAPDLVARLDAHAAKHGLSRNAAVERFIVEGLERTEAPRSGGHRPKATGASHGKPPKQGSGGRKDAPVVRVEISGAPRKRPSRIVGFDPVSGAPIYGR